MTFPCLLIAIVLGTSGDQAKPPETSLSKILKERRSITSGELRIRVQFSEIRPDPETINSKWSIHYWFDSKRGVYRIDRKIVGNGHFDAEVHSDRSCFDGSGCKIIDEAQSLMPLLQYSYVPNTAPDAFEPRVLGLFIVPFLWTHHFKLDDVQDIIEGASSVKRSAAAGRVREEYARDDQSKKTYVFNDNGQLVAYEYHSAAGKPDQHYRADIEPQRYRDSLDFPRTIHFVEKRNGATYFDETITIEVVQFNEPIDPSLFSWASLGPRPGARLVINADYFGCQKSVESSQGVT